MCVESYSAVLQVRVWRGGRLLDEATLHSAALEFGGTNVCASRNPCRSTDF